MFLHLNNQQQIHTANSSRFKPMGVCYGEPVVQWSAWSPRSKEPTNWQQHSYRWVQKVVCVFGPVTNGRLVWGITPPSHRDSRERLQDPGDPQKLTENGWMQCTHATEAIDPPAVQHEIALEGIFTFKLFFFVFAIFLCQSGLMWTYTTFLNSLLYYLHSNLKIKCPLYPYTHLFNFKLHSGLPFKTHSSISWWIKVLLEPACVCRFMVVFSIVKPRHPATTLTCAMKSASVFEMWITCQWNNLPNWPLWH